MMPLGIGPPHRSTPFGFPLGADQPQHGITPLFLHKAAKLPELESCPPSSPLYLLPLP